MSPAFLTTSGDRRRPLVSVVIPVFNEAKTLETTIGAIHAETVPIEVIVVDAESSDESAAVAKKAGARIICSHFRQRAHQLNLGAQQARAEMIIFLHADTILPLTAIDRMVNVLRVPTIAGGAFRRRYASPSKLLRITCLLAFCRNFMIGWHLGDQAMFVRRSVFFQLGGFREVDQFEDLDFSRRLGRFGRIVTLSPCVTSSARRFDSGAARTTLRDFALTIRYLGKGLPEARPLADLGQTVLS
jgi:rSAM/selenodomain-associated transferase 2